MPADFYSNFWTGLKSVIHATWTEIAPSQLLNDVNLERRDWINLLNAGQIVGPWCVVSLSINQTQGWGIGTPRYQFDAAISYICPTGIDKSSVPYAATITEYLSARLISLQAALAASPALGTVLPTLPLDVNASQDINRVLLDAKLPFQSSTLTVSCIVLGVSF